MSAARERLDRIRRAAVRVDADTRLVDAFRAARRRIPGAPQAHPSRAYNAVARGYEALAPDRESAVHEIGLGALQAWQALSERAGRGRGSAEVAIVFTDLAGFSRWALQAGDEPAVELLRKVAEITDRAVEGHDGTVVKQLGDGAMAVFEEAQAGAEAVLDALDQLEGVEVAGHRPALRAGLHHGRPRRMRGDFLGIDVNIAARVAAAAKGAQLLASEPTAQGLDPARIEVGRPRRLRAKGAPGDLRVCSLRRRATLDDGPC